MTQDGEEVDPTIEIKVIACTLLFFLLFWVSYEIFYWWRFG